MTRNNNQPSPRAIKMAETNELKNASFRKSVLRNISYERLCELINIENEKRKNKIDKEALLKEIKERRENGQEKNATNKTIEEELEEELQACLIECPTETVYVYSWCKNSGRFPSVDVMAIIAKEAKCNIAYLMSLTDISAPIDTNNIDFNLAQLRSAQGLAKTEFAKKMGIATDLLHRYECNGLKTYRLNTLLRFCKEFNCSIDYLLGLTKYRNWDNLTLEEDLIAGIRGGSPLYIKTVDGTIDGNCILSNDRNTFYFADGTKKRVKDKIFIGALIKQFALS